MQDCFNIWQSINVHSRLNKKHTEEGQTKEEKPYVYLNRYQKKAHDKIQYLWQKLAK